MGQMTCLFAYKVAAIIEVGLDRAALLGSLGLDPEDDVDPRRMVDADAYYRFLETIVHEEEAGHTLPLRVGATMRSDEYGVFGLAWKSAPDLRASFLRAERYSRVLNSTTRYEIEDTRQGTYLHLHREGPRHLGMRLSNEATIVSLLTISREAAADDLHPLEIYFRHAAPAVVVDHEAYFGCPVHFGTDRDALLFVGDDLRRPNKLGDLGMVAFFDQHLEQELESVAEESSLGQRVKKQLVQVMSDGVPPVSNIASKLAMSGRSLQRKLADQGLSYQGLVDDARRELAQELLRASELPLAEIAFLTGFSEQSSFNRAFKRWAGQTPRSCRLQSQAR